MASETSQESTVRSGEARRPVLAGIAIAVAVAVVIVLSTTVQSLVGVGSPVWATIVALSLHVIFGAMILAGTLVAVWSRTAALTAAISVIATHVLVNTVMFASMSSGLGFNPDGLGEPAFSLFSGLINLGSTYWLGGMAGALVGGWVVVTVLERTGRSRATSA